MDSPDISPTRPVSEQPAIAIASWPFCHYHHHIMFENIVRLYGGQLSLATAFRHVGDGSASE